MSGCCFCLSIALVQHIQTRADKNLVATQHELVLPLSMPGEKAGLLSMAVRSACTAKEFLTTQRVSQPPGSMPTVHQTGNNKKH
jgi:hypothetical protein